MDVCGIFISDTSMSYGSMRNTIYRDYEQFPYGTLENVNLPIKDNYSRVQEKCQQINQQKNGKKPCPFCKEHKKRPLISYLRKRENHKHNEKICEEDEEENAEEQEHEHHHHNHEENTDDMMVAEGNAEQKNIQENVEKKNLKNSTNI